MILNHYEEIYAITNDNEIRIFKHYCERGDGLNFDTYSCNNLEFTSYFYDEPDEVLGEYLPDFVHLNLADCDSFFKDEQSKSIKNALKICRVNPSDVDKFLHLSVVHNRITEKIGVYIEIIDKEGRHPIRPESLYSQDKDEEIILIKSLYSEFNERAVDNGIFNLLSENTRRDLNMISEEIMEI